MDLCRKDKWREESDARGNVSGRGGVWPRGELNRDMGMTMKIT